jgi:hypothetical protein
VPCPQIPTPAESQANETARIGGINGQRFGVINAILREALTTAIKDPTRSGPAAHGVSAIVALPAREPVRAVGQRPLQFLPSPYPLAQPAEAEEPARRVQPVHGRCRLPARE